MAAEATNGRRKGDPLEGRPAVDPSQNVKELTEAANRRQDDLREAAEKLADAKIKHQKECSCIREAHQDAMALLREQYQARIASAESNRLDSIRQVDREEVAKTAVAANTAITTLAKQTNDLAVTLAKTVADTAAAAEARNSAQYSDTNKRLSALELSSSEGKGKQGVADPQMERLSLMVEQLGHQQTAGSAKTEGMSDMWKLIIGAVGLIATLSALGVFDRMTAVQPPPIYTPAPQGTVLPVSPPQTPP